jgi:hypothetical protein
VSGAVGAVGPFAVSWDQRRRLLWFGVLCVVVPGASRSGLLSWAGVLCDMAAGVGQCEHGGGTQTMHLVGLPLVGSPLLCVAPKFCPTSLTSLK